MKIKKAVAVEIETAPATDAENDADVIHQMLEAVKPPRRIELNQHERRTFSNEMETIRRGEEAQHRLAAIAIGIVERAGHPPGDYMVNQDGSALIERK